jgi:hypothetical protein
VEADLVRGWGGASRWEQKGFHNFRKREQAFPQTGHLFEGDKEKNFFFEPEGR